MADKGKRKGPAKKPQPNAKPREGVKYTRSTKGPANKSKQPPAVGPTIPVLMDDGCILNYPCVDFEDVADEFWAHMETYGRVLSACKYAGVSYVWVNREAKQNKAFGERIRAAKQMSIERLEMEAMRRGAEGYLKPIIGGRDRDMVVAHERVYSDACLSMILNGQKATMSRGAGAVPAEIDADGNSVGGSGYAALCVPHVCISIEEWEEIYGEIVGLRPGDIQ